MSLILLPRQNNENATYHKENHQTPCLASYENTVLLSTHIFHDVTLKGGANLHFQEVSNC